MTIPTEDLVEDLKRVASKLEKPPTVAEYDTHGNYSTNPYYNRFGEWADAKAAANLARTDARTVSDEELLEDLKRVASKLEKSPSQREYNTYGDHSPTTYTNRFGGWNDAKAAANLSRTNACGLSDEELLKDVKRVALMLEKSPTQREYDTHGDYHHDTYNNKFGGWNNTKAAANLSRTNACGLSDTDLLKHIRKNSKNSHITSIPELKKTIDYSQTPYRNRFGMVWRATVRSGIHPPRSPLSETDYDSYIQTAINIDNSFLSLYGLLRAFTGMPQHVLQQFSLDWISRLDSDIQPPLLTVPSEYIPSDDDWVMVIPSHYTIAGDQKPTHLKPLVRWLKNVNVALINHRNNIKKVIKKADLDIGPSALRTSVAAQLVRQGASRGEIEMQVGASKTNWRRSVEDFFLYLYQFEDYCHPDYEPSGTYLDPETGEVTEI
jgi:hypothetical protein